MLTYLHFEVIERVLIDVLHLVHEAHGVVGQSSNMRPSSLIVGGVIKPRRSHVCAADCLNLF